MKAQSLSGSFYQHRDSGRDSFGRVGTRGPSGDYDYLPTLLRSPLLAGARQEV
jgi:hypothetical protein